MTLVYVTSNENKREEVEILRSQLCLDDGRPIRELFDFDIRPNSIDERLEIDLRVMVEHEAVCAYELVKVPCIVEHAGLIFDDFSSSGYPGGLTKPMWNALGPEFFLTSISLRTRRAMAQAVVGYCDGMKVQTFVGCTHGRLSDRPRGSRHFYWDTVFVPDDPSRPDSELTYAEIADDADLGVAYKVTALSQSTKAMRRCLDHIRVQRPNILWR